MQGSTKAGGGSVELERLLYAAESLNGISVFDVQDRWTVLSWGDGPLLPPGPDWRARARDTLLPSARDPRLPLSGGLVGWLSYELGGTMERMPEPAAPAPLPALGLWRVEGALCLDRRRGRWRLGGSPEFRDQAEDLLERASRVELPPAPTPAPEGWERAPRPELAERWQGGVRAVLEHIRAGDVYQVNLAWEEQDLPARDPLESWLALRKANPARRGALIRRDGVTLVSNSPELFLRVRRRGERLWAWSAPIKGTADARGGEATRETLQHSEKERAELTMIVDLVRNDLGRVASTGTVRAGPRRIVRCGDLWHAEQTVRARLRRGADALDLLAATFPPGSVTGAPKVEAMKIIGALEPGPRGVYTGAIGWLADGGEAHLNVAIRTATVAGGRARFHVGAGLVADSEPAREWAETLAKGRTLARWLSPPAPRRDP